MARTLPKDRLLPSLLDRLTDDDPVNHSIQQLKKNIQVLEAEWAALAKQADRGENTDSSQSRALKQQLESERHQYSVLLDSVSSLREIRACVKRDLDWLLNAHYFVPQEDLSAYPEIEQSVLNYGMPDLTGRTASGMDIPQLERELKQIILKFEPRILRQTLSINFVNADSSFSHNALAFEIEGELWADPVPIHMYLRTELNLENGGMSIAEFQA